MTNPWSTIEDCALTGAVRARRVSADHPVDLFWAKDATGAFCFIADNISCDRNVKLPQLFGIEMILADGSNAGFMRIVMKLRNVEWWQVFYTLCCDIIDVSMPELPEKFLKVLLGRLVKWQAMLRLLSEERMSQQAVQGLWGELMFMYKHLAPTLGWRSAVEAWEGPCGHPQDFSVGEEPVEVKTLQNTARMEVKISSLDQLDAIGGKMFLHVTVVGLSHDEDNTAMSLNELVDCIKNDLGSDATIRDEFDERLAKAGYVFDQEYDRPRFFIVEEYTYEVREGFPRICKSRLPVGVESGTYTIFLGNSKEFLKKPNWMEA